MSGFADTRRVIENHFLNGGLGVPVYLENMRRPSAGGDPPSPLTWVALTIGPETFPTPRTNRLSLGPTPVRRYEGAIVVNVFGELRKGREATQDVADAVSSLVQEVVLSAGSWRIRLGSARLLGGHPAPDGAYWQENLIVPYDRTA